MTRIATSQMSQTLLNQLLRNQSQSMEFQRQVATGKKAADLKGFGAEAPALLAAKGLQTRTAGYLNTLNQFKTQTEAQNIALVRAEEAGQYLREGVTNALSLAKGDTLIKELEHAFGVLREAMNTRQAGQYLFSGVNTGTAPIAIDQLQDLDGLNLDDAFADADRARMARMDGNQIVEAAPLAEDVTRDAFAAFQRIIEYHNNTEAFGGELSQAQKAFLQTELGNITAANDKLVQATAQNGVTQARIDEAIVRQSREADFLEVMVGDMENVDMAEAVSRLQASEIAVEASARVFSSLSRSSLLDFLR